ncbi:adenylyl/guanylyl cyclase [Fragilaria crotonensis]|nr:adenylyl/guanylyl cyclase [Fragilaria crotonensis]
MIFNFSSHKTTNNINNDCTRERSRDNKMLPFIPSGPTSIQDGTSVSHQIGCFTKTSHAPYQICTRLSHPNSRVLGDDYVPQEYDVICARGKHVVSHFGNIVFRVTVERNLERYHQARSRLDKSIIVIEIVDEIRSRSPHGGFIQQKKDRSDGRKVWIEIGDTMARAKVGHALRDAVRSNSSNSVSTTPDLTFRHSTSSSASSLSSDNDSCLDDEDVDAVDMSNTETTWTLHNEDAREKRSSCERRTHGCDASELLRMSLISIQDTAFFAFDDQLLSDDEECSQDSFDSDDVVGTIVQALEMEGFLVTETSQ